MKCIVCGSELNSTGSKCSKCGASHSITKHKSLFAWSANDKAKVKELKNKYSIEAAKQWAEFEKIRQENIRKEEQKRIQEENRKQEEQRKADLKKAEEKAAAEKKAAEERKKAEEAKKAEQKKLDEQKRKQEQARLAEQKRIQEQKERERQEALENVRLYRILGVIATVVVIVLFYLISKVGLWVTNPVIVNIVYGVMVFFILGCGIFGVASFSIASDENKKLK